MQVTMVLKKWKVNQDAETKLPTISGTYGLMMGDKEIASQDFNEGYSSKKLPISNDLINEVTKLEVLIRTEMERLLS